jgi:hypothetical protein
LQEPGLYHVLWDNTYSWFRQKHIRYRFTLLEEISIDNPILEPEKPVYSTKKDDDFSVTLSIVVRDEDILLDINGETSTIEEQEDLASAIKELIS